MSIRIPLNRDKLTEFCVRHYICKLALFGSVLREDFRADSDVDILVEFDPEHRPGMVRWYGWGVGWASRCWRHPLRSAR